jgi:hypothetical protein
MFRFDSSRWAPADRVACVATLVLFVSLFLPWFGVSLLGITATADGLTAHGYLYIVLLLALALLAYLVLRAGYETPPFRLPVSHERLLLAGTGLNLLLVLIAFLSKPALAGWQWGAFVGLAAALAAAAPVATPALRSLNRGQHALNGAPRPPAAREADDAR